MGEVLCRGEEVSAFCFSSTVLKVTGVKGVGGVSIGICEVNKTKQINIPVFSLLKLGGKFEKKFGQLFILLFRQ